jgi:hypothetical protein
MRLHRPSAATLCLFLAQNALGQEFRTIHLSDWELPGQSVGVRAAINESPSINHAGEIAFPATLSGPNVDDSNDDSIWISRSGAPQLVARESQPAPGAGGAAYGYFRNVSNAVPGRVAFQARLGGAGVTGANHTALWLGPDMIARKGDPAPGTSGSLTAFDEVARWFSIAPSGQTVFHAYSGFDRGLWSGTPGNVALLAISGASAPGIPQVEFDAIRSEAVINSGGQVAFFAGLRGSGVTSSNATSIWTGTPGNLRLVARQGAPTPQPGLTFKAVLDPAINSRGDVAFFGEIEGTGVDGANNRGLWIDSGAGPTLAVRTGEPAPDTSARFASLGSPLLNANRQLAFGAALAGDGVDASTDSGIWVGQPNQLRLVAREGSAAPGTTDGARINTLRVIALNGPGQLALLASLAGSGVSSTNDTALYLTDLDRHMHLIAREGSPFEVAPDESRIVTELFTINSPHFLDESGGSDGNTIILNDLGQFAFALRFAEGSSGIFVAAVPEPTLLVGLLACVCLLMRRRSRTILSRPFARRAQPCAAQDTAGIAVAHDQSAM